MIDLYAMGSPNVVKIYIALEEMGLPYTVHPVDVFGEAQFDPEFLKPNPNAKVPFLGGASYSIADIATFPWARNVGTLLGKAAEADYPKLMAWVETIAARPAVKRALAAVDDVRGKTTQFDKAGAEAMDRLFGRGRHGAAA